MTNLMRLAVTAVTVGALVGCNGNSASGSVKGVAFSPQDAVFHVAKLEGDEYLVLFMTDQPNTCQLLKSNKVQKNATSFGLILGVRDAQGNTKTPVTGSYTVQHPTGTTTGNTAVAFFNKTDSACNSTFGNNIPLGTAGTVVLSSFTAKEGGMGSGSFDIQFGSDSLMGAFSATYCDIPMNTEVPTCE